jgi:hypothetical protein
MKINLTPFAAFLRPLYTESGRSSNQSTLTLLIYPDPIDLSIRDVDTTIWEARARN